MRNVVTLVAGAVIAIAATQSAFADSVNDGYNQALKAASAPVPMGPDLFGDRTSLLDGQTEFEIIDIALPTNGAIPVVFGRRLQPSALVNDRNGGNNLSKPIFGNYWEPMVPHMSGTFDARVGWVGPGTPANRCSTFSSGPGPVVGVGAFSKITYQSGDYYDGIRVSIPGFGDEDVWTLSGASRKPTDGKTYVMSTRSEWRVSCVPALKNAGGHIPGEGYSVLLPNGIRYTFDWMVSTPTTSIVDATCQALVFARSPNSSAIDLDDIQNYCTSGTAVPRYKVYLFATEASDRFGNRVVYTFDPANPRQLSSIQAFDSSGASEGVITFSYSQGRVASATTGARTWHYTYDASQRLSEVVQPDASKWSYVYEGNWADNFYDILRIWDGCVVNIGTKTTAVSPGPGESSALTVSAPSGATGRFEFRSLLFGTREGETTCYYRTYSTGTNIYSDLIVGHQTAYQIHGLVRKTISGPGVTPASWNFSYAPTWVAPFKTETVVHSPDGATRRYTFGNTADTVRPVGDFGLLLESTIEQGGQVRRKEVYSYAFDPTGQLYPPTLGAQHAVGAGLLGSNMQPVNRPLVRRDIVQDGRTFTWRVADDCGASRQAYCFDAFTRPTKIVRSSTQ